MPPPTALAGLPVSRKGDKRNRSESLAITPDRSDGVTRNLRNPTRESSTPNRESSNPSLYPTGNRALLPGSQSNPVGEHTQPGHTLVVTSSISMAAMLANLLPLSITPLVQARNVCRRWTTSYPCEAGAQGFVAGSTWIWESNSQNSLSATTKQLRSGRGQPRNRGKHHSLQASFRQCLTTVMSQSVAAPRSVPVTLLHH